MIVSFFQHNALSLILPQRYVILQSLSTIAHVIFASFQKITRELLRGRPKQQTYNPMNILPNLDGEPQRFALLVSSRACRILFSKQVSDKTNYINLRTAFASYFKTTL
jgi:hypothetical protein